MKLQLASIIGLLIFGSDLVAQPSIKIGVSLALTGPAANIGADQKNALILANEELTGGKYEFLVEDDKCSGREAASIAQKFVSVQHIKYVLGLSCSGAMLGAIPIYNKTAAIVMSSTASAPAISCSGPGIFRTWPSDVAAADELAKFVSRSHKSVGILSEETEYPVQIAAAFKKSLPVSVQVVAESYPPGTSDFRSLILKLQARGVEALFLNPQADTTLAQMLRNMRQLNLHFQLYGAFFPSGEAFLKTAGADAEGLIYVDLPSVEERLPSDSGRSFLAKFKSRFGNPLFSDLPVLTTFESFSALHQAIESGIDPKVFMKKHTFDGTLGAYTFNQCGDISGLRPVMRKISAGRPSLVGQ